jgi:hypothetical protein
LNACELFLEDGWRPVGREHESADWLVERVISIRPDQSGVADTPHHDYSRRLSSIDFAKRCRQRRSSAPRELSDRVLFVRNHEDYGE